MITKWGTHIHYSNMSSAAQHNPVYLAADHAGFEMKQYVKDALEQEGFVCTDLGAHSYDEHDDYPGIMKVAALRLAAEPYARALVFGGSGQGEALVLNRTRGVRAAVFYGPRAAITEIDNEKSSPAVDGYDPVRLARVHNNANALSFGARFMTHDEAYRAALLFLGTPFSGAERHQRRIDGIDQ